MQLRARLSEGVEPVVWHRLRHLLQDHSAVLSSVIEAVRSDWLPSEDDPLLETLSDFLIHSGYPPVDPFLLRYGLTVPGRMRGVRPPLPALSQKRGGLSSRRLSEAERAIGGLVDELAVGHWFLVGLSSETEAAIRQLWALLEREPESPFDEVRVCRCLSNLEVDELSMFALHCLDSGVKEVQRVGDDVLERLACFRHQPLSQATCEALLERRHFSPPSIFRDAGDGVAVGLLETLSGLSDPNSLRELLPALAWTRSREAADAFRRWASTPPSWSSEPFILPSEYPRFAGWTLDEGTDRRDLISTVCRQLELSDDGDNTVRCFTSVDLTCPSCHGSLSTLFDFTHVAASVMAGWHVPARIVTCVACSCPGPFYTLYRDGEAQPLIADDGRSYGDDDVAMDEVVMKVSDSDFPPFATAGPFLVDEASTVGGTPMWLQDAEYPECPRCGLAMPFVAQFNTAPIGQDGIFYAFYCSECQCSAVSSQWT